MVSQVAAQTVQPVARQVHMLRMSRHVEPGQDALDLSSVLWWDSAAVALVEALQALCLKLCITHVDCNL